MLILPFYLHTSLMTSKNLLICCFRDKIKTEQIVKSLNLKISARDSRHNDSRVLLKALFDQWLPLSSSLLSMVIDKLPSPAEILSERVEKLMCSGVRTFDSLPDETQSLKDGELRRLFSLSFLAIAPNLFCIFFYLICLPPFCVRHACKVPSFQGMCKHSKSYIYILAIR